MQISERSVNRKPVPSRSHSRRSLRLLTATGIVMLLASLAYYFLLYAHAMWAAPSLIPDKWKQVFWKVRDFFPHDWIMAHKDTPIGLMNSLIYLGIVLVMFTTFFFLLWRAFQPGRFSEAQRGAALRRIMFFLVAMLLVLLIVPGMLSTDVMSYIWYGRIWGVYGDSPFTHAPSQYVWADKAKWIQWVYWQNTPSVYGPVWVWMAGAIAKIAQAIDGDIATNILGNKIAVSFAHIINTVLVWRASRLIISRYWRMPNLPQGVTRGDWVAGAQVAVTLAYAWNPLMLVEFGANGHNDIFLVTGLLAAINLHLAGRWRLAALAIACASLTKFIALFFLPGYLWLLFWEVSQDGTALRVTQRLSKVGQAVGIVALAWVAGYLPFWEGPATLKPLSGGPPAEYFINSLGTVVRLRLPEVFHNVATFFGWKPEGLWTTGAIGARLDWPARWGLLLIAGTAAALHTWGARTFPRMMISWGWVMFTYLTIGSVWYWPWYAAWLIVPVVLVGPGRLFMASQFFFASSLVLYTVFPSMVPSLSWITGWAGLIIVGPPLLYLAASRVWEAVRRGKEEQAGPEAGERNANHRAVPVPVVPEPSPSTLASHQSAFSFVSPEYVGSSEADEIISKPA